ncbi:hypothetical protein EON65_47325 [archaeon]|nr:MAG: hypothetical protein EON65_47325 [archaeon]
MRSDSVFWHLLFPPGMEQQSPIHPQCLLGNSLPFLGKWSHQNLLDVKINLHELAKADIIG